MKKINIFFPIIIIILLSGCTDNNNQWTVSSPNGSLSMSISLQQNENANSVLQYSVKDNNQVMVINPSPLGIKRADQQFIEGLSFVAAGKVKTIDNEYTMLTGKQSVCHNHANERVITFKNENNATVALVCRAYNNGIAFKYRFPEKSEKKKKVVEEITGFNMPSGKTWIHPYDTIRLWSPAYELYWKNGVKTGTPAPEEEGWAFPALFQTDNHWILISEAGVYKNYCGAHLQPECENGLYKIRYPEKNEWNGIPIAPESMLPWETPWRFAAIGTSQGTILESSMAHHLSKPCALENTSWIQPGKASWSWWSDHDSPTNFKKLKTFVDLAATMGWKYSLVDANWQKMEGGGDIKDLIEYAKSKNVGLLLWYNSGGDHNEVTEGPRNIMSDPEKRLAEMKKLQDWGVKGIKVDFFHSDKQPAIKYYLDILKDAAAHNILVVFHGCTMPRGWSRTYPNLMSMEAVLGAEQYWGGPFPEVAPWHNALMPFTRNVVGSMDYTPVTFTNYKAAHITTFAHELALSVLFESGIVHMADRVSGYLERPEKVIKFLKEVPVTWDETYYIEGYPGKYTVLARKKGDKYYIAGINGTMQEKILEFTLPFLDDNKYKIDLIMDGENPDKFSYKTIDYSNEQKIAVKILGAGGFTGVISR